MVGPEGYERFRKVREAELARQTLPEIEQPDEAYLELREQCRRDGDQDAAEQNREWTAEREYLRWLTR